MSKKDNDKVRKIDLDELGTLPENLRLGRGGNVRRENPFRGT